MCQERVFSMELRRQLAFVALPFRYPYYPDHFDNIIKPALEEAGYEVEKAADIYYAGLIIEQIKQSIVRADLIVCELTGRNANVLYELGLAHSLGKPAVVMTQDEGDVPFDLRHRPFLRYDPTQRGWQRHLRQRLTSAARDIATNGSDERPLHTHLLPPDDMRVAARTHDKQLYAIIGLKPEEPVETTVFQTFTLDSETNMNPVANLWADPKSENHVAAHIHRESRASLLRVRFESSEGTLSPTVAIHPEGLLARRVPPNCTKLTFEAKLVPTGERSERSDVTLAIRVVNGHAEHWTYWNQNTNGLTKFKVVDAAEPRFEVDLRTGSRWQLFRGAGNHAPNPKHVDFSVVTSVVFELGCGGSARELGHGQGEVDIGCIRFE